MPFALAAGLRGLLVGLAIVWLVFLCCDGEAWDVWKDKLLARGTPEKFVRTTGFFFV